MTFVPIRDGAICDGVLTIYDGILTIYDDWLCRFNDDLCHICVIIGLLK